MPTAPQADEALIPLSAAAAHVLQKLLPAHIANDERSCDSLLLVASAMSALIPIYREDSLTRLTEAELAGARFAEGAATIVLRTGERITRLAVRGQDLESATDTLVASYIGSAHSARAAAPQAAEPATRGKRRQ